MPQAGLFWEPPIGTDPFLKKKKKVSMNLLIERLLSHVTPKNFLCVSSRMAGCSPIKA